MPRSVVTHQKIASGRSHWATARCTAGSVLRRCSGRGGQWVASATRPLGAALLASFQPDQQAIRQQDCDHMPVQPRPQPPLVRIPAQLPLGLCMQRLHRVAPMGIAGQRCPRGCRGQIAPGVLPLLGLPLRGTLPDQPAQVPLAMAGYPPRPPRHTLLAQPPLSPPPPAHRPPLPAGHAVEPRVCPPHRTRRRTASAHLEGCPPRDHRRLLARLQARQNVRVVSVIGLGDQAALGHAPGPRLIKQGQGNLCLSLASHRGGPARRRATLGGVCPGLRQIPPHGHWPCGVGIGLAAGHRHLTVAHLPQCPRILPLDADRALPLRGKARLVEHQDPLAPRGLGDHLLHPLPVEVLFIPLHLGEKCLQPLLTGPWHGLGDRIAVLVGQLREQPRRLPLQGGPALRSSETHLETGQTLLQLRPFRRTGMHIHRYPPLRSEDTTAQ
jgi:hypothetical protein